MKQEFAQELADAECLVRTVTPVTKHVSGEGGSCSKPEQQVLPLGGPSRSTHSSQKSIYNGVTYTVWLLTCTVT